MESVRVKETLARASAAALVGEQNQARSLYEEALRLAPETVEGWLGLAGLVDHPEDKRVCFMQVLRLDAENAEAQAGLEILARRNQMPRRRDEVVPDPDPMLGSFIRETSARLAAATDRHEHTAEAGLADEAEDVMYCVNHPNTETLLRCNKCGRPMCMRCVRLTDVGYRCKDCIAGQQAVYFNAENLDYPVAFGVGFVVSAVAAPIAGMLLGGLGFFGFIIAFLGGSAAGGVLAETIHRAVNRRRGRNLWIVAFAGIILGVLAGSIAARVLTGFFPLFSLTMLIFVALALSTTYARLR